MTERSIESARFEVDYWKAVIADVTALNELIGRGADELMGATPAIIALSIAAPSHLAAEADGLAKAVAATMATLRAMQAPLARLLDLSSGRAVVVREEMGL